VDWIQQRSSSRIQYFRKVLPAGGSKAKIVKMIGPSDCLLVSRDVSIGADVFNKCKSLKYVGVFGTSLLNVDLKAAKVAGVVVTNVAHYCDFDVAEFILTELLQKARGLGKICWKNAPCSLRGKKLGIIGLGKIGKCLAQLAQAHGMDISYFDVQRNLEVEKAGTRYLGLHDLLRQSEIISVQVPKDSRVLSPKEFKLIKDGTLLMSTSQGTAFDLSAFRTWIKNSKNIAVFDSVGGESYLRFKSLKNVSISAKGGYVTQESMARLTEAFFNNIERYLESK
jgi:phosphoglycerate dehydrogenase-like enzyme